MRLIPNQDKYGETRPLKLSLRRIPHRSWPRDARRSCCRTRRYGTRAWRDPGKRPRRRPWPHRRARNQAGTAGGQVAARVDLRMVPAQPTEPLARGGEFAGRRTTILPRLRMSEARDRTHVRCPMRLQRAFSSSRSNRSSDFSGRRSDRACKRGY
jgi:hypothetical protein